MAVSPGLKLQGREGGHSSSSSTDVEDSVELYLYSRIRLRGLMLN
jgi:hypothetical protein